MSETTRTKLSWLFVALLMGVAVLAFGTGSRVAASDDHDAIQALREDGRILPLSTVLASDDLAGMRVLEADLEREHGRFVYELEVLDAGGHVTERYYDAVTGQRID